VLRVRLFANALQFAGFEFTLPGNRMTRSVTCVLFLLTTVAAVAQQPTPTRPKITGIDHVAFYTTSPDANQRLYTTVLGLPSAPPLEPGQATRFMIGSQWVGYSSAPDAKATDRMDHVAFRTEDCEGLRVYLAASGVRVPDSVTRWKEGSCSFAIKDTEGNAIEFVQWSKAIVVKAKIAGSSEPFVKPDPVSRRLIHAGFIVHDRTAEDHFYKDILGFHLYWQGGMQTDRNDWVAMQVPDGTDWLEYMLNQPANPDLRLSGVLNHISLGVKDMKAAQAKLEAHGWKPHGDEHSQMGKDGKWQLNIYDPDMTRIELMEFTPAQKPCCSEFQGQHPTEPN
jgi:catechol 2,3-dioxygenase-like lactoylglutathione lyase family enzyme